MKRVWGSILALIVFHLLQTENIYLPYGSSNGDTKITSWRQYKGQRYIRHGNLTGYKRIYSDFVSETISVQTGFPLGDNFYYSLYVSYISKCLFSSLTENIDFIIPRKFSVKLIMGTDTYQMNVCIIVRKKGKWTRKSSSFPKHFSRKVFFFSSCLTNNHKSFVGLPSS